SRQRISAAPFADALGVCEQEKLEERFFGRTRNRKRGVGGAVRWIFSIRFLPRALSVCPGGPGFSRSRNPQKLIARPRHLSRDVHIDSFIPKCPRESRLLRALQHLHP